MDVTWILSSQRSGDEEEDTLHVVLRSTRPLPRHSCQIVQAHQLWGVQLLDLDRFESKYVGIYLLVLVKTGHILSPAQTLKLPFEAGEMTQWVKGLH